MLPLICPHCQQPLFLDQRHASCNNQHQFDRSKEGYWNLLPVNQKKSRQPGDSDAMILARQRFLNQGYYQPTVDALTQLLQAYEPNNMVDVGCGEGFYTRQLASSLAIEDVVGLDISKDAIRRAAKQDAEAQHTWLVASAKKLPLADRSTDLTCSIFAYPVAAEMKRVLSSKGMLLLVAADQNHLLELRQRIYRDVTFKSADSQLAQFEDWTLVDAQEIKYSMNINSANDILDLLHMTPHYWRAKPELQQELLQLQTLELSVHKKAFLLKPNV